MTTLLTIWIMIMLLCFYLWLGITFYEAAESSYKLTLVHAIMIIFLWPIVMPIGLLLTQSINAYYILKNAYNKSKK